MKIAVLYSGHLRSWNRVKSNQENSFYTPKTDTFFYTYDEPENTKYKSFVRIPGTYYDQPLSIYDANKNPITCTDNTLQAWHNLFVGFCLVPKTYDVYVKSRCDIELSGKIDFTKYDINDTNIYIPSGNDHFGGKNDQFAFGSYSVMKKYYSIYLEHQNLFRKGLVFHTELYVTENLKAKGVNIIRLDITNLIIRQDMETAYSENSRRIVSELPTDHWNMLQVKDKRVLDLGCGRMWDNPTTPQYFLDEGANSVIGVEMWPNERIWFFENVKDVRLTVITDEIKTVEQLKGYLLIFKPQVIKCDIEGMEKLFMDFTAKDFETVEQMAMEYHGPDMKKMVEDKYLTWGFKEIFGFTMDNFNKEEQGVIYIKK
jgi:hypothetical protein